MLQNTSKHIDHGLPKRIGSDKLSYTTSLHLIVVYSLYAVRISSGANSKMACWWDITSQTRWIFHQKPSTPNKYADIWTYTKDLRNKTPLTLSSSTSQPWCPDNVVLITVDLQIECQDVVMTCSLIQNILQQQYQSVLNKNYIVMNSV